jgi:hypothetical protein
MAADGVAVARSVPGQGAQRSGRDSPGWAARKGVLAAWRSRRRAGLAQLARVAEAAATGTKGDTTAAW